MASANSQPSLCCSGRYQRIHGQNRTALERSAARLLRLAEPSLDERVAVLVTGNFGVPPGAAASVGPTSGEVLGFSLAYRLDAWVAPINETTVCRVPTYLSAYFRCAQATVVPLRSPGWRGGAIVVDASELAGAQLTRLQALAACWALAMESPHQLDLEGEMPATAPSLSTRRPSYRQPRRVA